MDDTSKLRMNLAAIKKVDPYAKDIVDTSPHVAFYTFNSDKNEWEKTDVEGAFFVYSRNAQPYYSVFINNRLNTTSFVEPVTGQLELQSQPPFLLYRNERSRIRGFWFYNSEECDRIGNLLKTLVEQNGGGGGGSGSGSDGGDAADNNSSSTANHNNNNNNISTTANGNGNQDNSRVSTPKQANVNIFNMLSKAQQEYNNMQNADSNLGNAPSGSVLKFFAAAKPTIPTNSETVSYAGQPVMPLSVEELEQQQRTQTPVAAAYPQQQQFNSVTTIPKIEPNVGNNMVITNIKQEQQQQQQSPIRESKIAAANATPFEKLFLQANSSFKTLPTGSSATINAHASCINVNDVENQLRNLLAQDVVTNSNSHSIGGIVPVIPSTVSLLNSPLASTAPMEFPINPKPALMPPTMFERSSTINDVVEPTPKPIQTVLNQSQMAQALIYLMQNDQDFVQKLHDAYVKVSTNKSLVDTFY